MPAPPPAPFTNSPTAVSPSLLTELKKVPVLPGTLRTSNFDWARAVGAATCRRASDRANGKMRLGSCMRESSDPDRSMTMAASSTAAGKLRDHPSSRRKYSELSYDRVRQTHWE